MPWQETDTIEQRRQFITAWAIKALFGGLTLSVFSNKSEDRPQVD